MKRLTNQMLSLERRLSKMYNKQQHIQTNLYHLDGMLVIFAVDVAKHSFTELAILIF